MDKPKHLTRIDIANSYAKALIETAQMTGDFRQWEDSLRQLSTLVRDDEFAAILRNPRFSQKEIMDFMDNILEKAGATEDEKDFVHLLGETCRLDLIPLVHQRFTALSEKAQGISLVQVVSAEEMTRGDEEFFKGILKEKFNITAHMTTSVDPTLISGFVISFDGKILDQSARGYRDRMDKLKKG